MKRPSPDEASIAAHRTVLRSLVGKLTKARKGLRKGSAQHSLVTNRLKALRFALTQLAPRPSARRAEWRDSSLHRELGRKAGREALRTLHYFERERPDDGRPRAAVDALLGWASGDRTLDMATVRRLALAAHAAARSARTGAAVAAARAAGQAIAAWHAPAHSLATYAYAQKAACASRRERCRACGAALAVPRSAQV